jgi:hypothetical protein
MQAQLQLKVTQRPRRRESPQFGVFSRSQLAPKSFLVEQAAAALQGDVSLNEYHRWPNKEHALAQVPTTISKSTPKPEIRYINFARDIRTDSMKAMKPNAGSDHKQPSLKKSTNDRARSDRETRSLSPDCSTSTRYDTLCAKRTSSSPDSVNSNENALQEIRAGRRSSRSPGRQSRETTPEPTFGRIESSPIPARRLKAKNVSEKLGFFDVLLRALRTFFDKGEKEQRVSRHRFGGVYHSFVKRY